MLYKRVKAIQQTIAARCCTTVPVGVCWLAISVLAHATPHRRDADLGGWMAEVWATRIMPCDERIGSPLQDERICSAEALSTEWLVSRHDRAAERAHCLDVELQVFFAQGDPREARALYASGRAAQIEQLQRCAPQRERSFLDGLARAMRRSVDDLASWRNGFSRRFRLDRLLLVRGRQTFGDRLALVLAVLRERLQRHACEARTVAERAAALVFLDEMGGAPHYRVRPGVILPERVELKVVELARAFVRRRGRRLLITSGTRSPRDQAAAMYTKLVSGGKIRGLYRKQRAASAIARAFFHGRAARRSRASIVAAMQRAIEAQIAQGVYVSPHLRAGAFDVRSRGLSRRDRLVLLQLARSYPWICQVKLERRPPHIHVRVAAEEGEACDPGEDLPPGEVAGSGYQRRRRP